MIGYIKGDILNIDLDNSVILVLAGNIGYEVHLTSSFAHSIFASNKTSISLFTSLIVKEDEHKLMGFKRLQDKKLFKMIIKVNSFGPKIAMAILSHLPQEEFIRAIMEKDEKALCSVSGVGKKGASRLVLEMRDSLKLNFSTEDFGSDDVKEVKMQASLALLALGYKNTEVDELINKATKDKKIFSVEELIQQSLKLGS